MFFFKLNKGQEAVVRFMYSEPAKLPIIKVHTVPVKINGKVMNAQYKCIAQSTQCPLCEKYSKDEYVRVMALYDYTDGQIKCWKTSSRAVISTIADSCADWAKPLNHLVFKIRRENDEWGTYSVAVMPDKSFPYPEGKLEVGLDEDVSYRYGMYRSANEMKEYLSTGVMPKHTKSESSGNNNSEDTWGKEYKEQMNNRKENNDNIASVAEAISPNANTPYATAPKPDIHNTDTTSGSTFTFSNNDDFALPF